MRKRDICLMPFEIKAQAPLTSFHYCTAQFVVGPGLKTRRQVKSPCQSNSLNSKTL